jgi:hypothetical protein
MKFVELVKFDEVFVKLKEIENPGHPNDFVSVWVAGRGWTQKNRKWETIVFDDEGSLLTGAPPVQTTGTCGAVGAPGGIQGGWRDCPSTCPI